MGSKIIIVDEKDNIIGSKDRDAVGQDDIYRVSALWIINSKGENLLARRALTKSHDPGKWVAAVVGTVENGETYESNIYKEAEEEIGLKGLVFQLGPKERVAGEYNYFVQWWTVKIDEFEGDFVLDKNEIEELRWFKKEEIMRKSRTNPDKFMQNAKWRVEMFCK